ncbi:hypothetical protein RI367_001145 [Sorochytrium milnesiophthora]
MPDDSPAAPRHALRDIVFGSAAGVSGKLVEYPFDTSTSPFLSRDGCACFETDGCVLIMLKVRLQAQPLRANGGASIFAGPFDCMRKTVAKEGVRGLYKGLSSPLVGAIMENATLFVVYNRIQSLVRSHSATANPDLPLSLPQLFLSGALAGTCTSFVLTPVELIQCRLQVQGLIAHQAPAATTTTTTAAPATATQSKPSLASSQRQSLARQRRYYARPTAKNLAALSYSGDTSFLRGSNVAFQLHNRRPNPASSAAVAATSSVAAVPYSGPLDVLVRTLRTRGIRGLYRGHAATMLRETGGGAAWFGIYEVVARHWIQRRQAAVTDGTVVTKADLAAWELMSAGAAAGVSYNVVLFPADVIKSRLQTQDVLTTVQRGRSGHQTAATRAVADGFVKVGLALFRTEGLRGLYRGCEVAVIKTTPTSAVIFGVYEWLNRTF